MVAIFLVYSDAANSEGLIELFPEDGRSIFFLPDNPSIQRIDLSSVLDKEHSYLCLEFKHRFALLRTFNSGHRPCSIVGSDQAEFDLPLSNASHFVSVILRPGDHFLAPSGRWEVRWDDDGKISESMRPPPLPLVTESTETSDTYPDTLAEMLDEHLPSPGGLSEATCSPTPSPAKERERPEPSTDAHENHEPRVEEPVVMALAREKEDTLEVSSDQRDLVEHPESVGRSCIDENSSAISSTAEHLAESEGILGTTKVAVNMQDISPPEGGGKIPAESENSLSTVDMTQTSENDHETTEEPRVYRGTSTPSTPTPVEPRVSKRKFGEIEGAGSDHSAANAESSLSIDAGLVDTIEIKRKAKRLYSSKDRSYLAKTPSRQPRRRQSSTPDTTSQRNTPGGQPPAKKRADRQLSTPSRAEIGGPTPVVIFSSATTVDQDKTKMRKFRKLGGRVTEAILEATILCVPDGTLKKTSKLVMAVALGIDIVTEKWIKDAHLLEKFPAPQSYLPLDRGSEQEWGINLEDAISRGKDGLTQLLVGVTVFFTKKLRSDLGKLERDFSQIATRLGAERIECRLPSLKREKPAESAALVIGVRDDPQGALVGKLGYTLFNKDILVMAALRGCLERDSEEFVIDVAIKEEEEP